MAKPALIAWFRRDLRVQDNLVLAQAASEQRPLIAAYIHAPAEAGEWAPGAASNWWLHHALVSLREELSRHGIPLVIRRGDSLEQLRALARDSGAGAVAWNRQFEPAAAARDERVRRALRDDALEVTVHNAALLWEPEGVRTRAGDPFRVYTPFWKHVRQLGAPRPVHVPADRLLAGPACDSLDPDVLELLPRIAWDEGFPDAWDPSLAGARRRLEGFAAEAAGDYAGLRDRPDVDGTSRLSPYLHFGQLGPRQVWQAIHETGAADTGSGYKYLGELAWREFAHHLLHHFPDTPEQALNPDYRAFPWREDADLLARWRRGRTGYPIVDAGMRQLWHTGWMHNRVRMVAASVLVKYLLQPWQSGARWFWDTLVDADLANNTMGWQWVAGCGADAAPYFRIFNPVLQGEKFDPEGDYVRRWVPELAALPAPAIHSPWTADDALLRRAGVRLGEDYPEPAVGLAEGRQRALDALQAMKRRRDG